MNDNDFIIAALRRFSQSGMTAEQVRSLLTLISTGNQLGSIRLPTLGELANPTQLDYPSLDITLNRPIYG